jgi:hypothetical protein
MTPLKLNISKNNIPKKIFPENNFLNKKRTKIIINNSPKTKIFKITKIKDKISELKKEQLSKINISKSFKRSSKYRGVSRNGNKWQVLIMINRKKTYIGNYDSEEDAAKAYDQYAIKYHGDKARTNFFYQGYCQVNNF